MTLTPLVKGEQTPVESSLSPQRGPVQGHPARVSATGRTGAASHEGVRTDPPQPRPRVFRPRRAPRPSVRRRSQCEPVNGPTGGTALRRSAHGAGELPARDAKYAPAPTAAAHTLRVVRDRPQARRIRLPATLASALRSPSWSSRSPAAGDRPRPQLPTRRRQPRTDPPARSKGVERPAPRAAVRRSSGGVVRSERARRRARSRVRCQGGALRFCQQGTCQRCAVRGHRNGCHLCLACYPGEVDGG